MFHLNKPYNRTQQYTNGNNLLLLYLCIQIIILQFTGSFFLSCCLFLQLSIFFNIFTDVAMGGVRDKFMPCLSRLEDIFCTSLKIHHQDLTLWLGSIFACLILLVGLSDIRGKAPRHEHTLISDSLMITVLAIYLPQCHIKDTIRPIHIERKNHFHNERR